MTGAHRRGQILSTDTERGDRIWRHRPSRLQLDRGGDGKFAATAREWLEHPETGGGK